MLEYTVKLGIYSESYSAEQITNLIGMKYDKCWVKGTPRSPKSEVIKFDEHAWFLVADPALKELTVNDQIESLLERIKPIQDKLKTLVVRVG